MLVNGDTTPETDETFFVNVTNATNAIVTDGQGLGTIVNDDITKIHDVQGNGATTPIPGATVTVEGVVTANFQGANKLKGFFLQEEDADADADPNTSEGIFIFCGGCPTPVAEGQRVKATGTVSEFADAPGSMTEIRPPPPPSVVVTDAGNHLAEVTPSPIALPIVGDLNAFYEAREGMLVTFVDPLTVSEYFELGRYGQIVLAQGGRPFQFTEHNPPSVAGYAAWEDGVARREVILDDDNNAQESYLTTSTPPGPPDGMQYVFYPRANGGFSVGTQGVDFFRGGDLVNGLTGVLHWSFPGFGNATWRIRPTAAHPATFTVANPRPVDAAGGRRRHQGRGDEPPQLLHDDRHHVEQHHGPLRSRRAVRTAAAPTAWPSSTASASGPRSSSARSTPTSTRFMELENTTPSDTINDILGAVNARCGGAHPYAFVNTGGTLGTDAIRVQQIYRTGDRLAGRLAAGRPRPDPQPAAHRPDL